MKMVKMPQNATKILDPYSGSGTTLLACKRLGVEAVGCEIDPEYIKITKNRLDPENFNEEPVYEEVEGSDDVLSIFGELDESY